MSISTTTNSFLNTVSNAAKAVFGAIKNAVLWSGRTVASGFNNYLVPAIQTIWSKVLPFLQAIGSFIKTGAVSAFNFLRTGYGLGGSIAAVGSVLFVHGYDQKERADQIVEQVAGVALIAVGVGIAVAFKALTVV